MCFARVSQSPVRRYDRCAVSFFHQRGHAGPAVTALGANPASPLSPNPRSGCLISGKGAAPPLPGTSKLSRYLGWQRSRAAHPTPGAARQRQGKPHHCFMLDPRSGSSSQLARRCSALPMHLVTARYRIVLTPHSHQRGHAPLQVAPLCFRVTSPLSLVQRPVLPVSARGAATPRPGGCRVTCPVLRNMAVRALWRWVWPRLAAHRG